MTLHEGTNIFETNTESIFNMTYSDFCFLNFGIRALGHIFQHGIPELNISHKSAP